jgi:hypothetical protein
MMTLRDAMTWLFGIGSLVAAATSCAAAPLPAGAPLHDRAAGYDVEVLVDGVPAPSYAHDGETYVLGQLGSRYTLRVNNHSPRRIEAVVSVDGRDVVDGKAAEFRNKRGYLVPAYGQIDIDGWRISNVEAAAFRFSTVPDSYAARTGSAREVGVIGVAVFPERYVPPAAPPRPPMPIYPRYPMAPESYRDDIGGGFGAADKSGMSRRSEERTQAETEPMTASPASPAARSSAAAADSAASEGAQQPYAERAPAKKAARTRAGLGTEYGEAVSSPSYEVQFVRANTARPAAILGLRYNDRSGLLAMGIDVDGNDWAFARDEELRRTAEPFPAAGRRYAAPPSGWRRDCCMR